MAISQRDPLLKSTVVLIKKLDAVGWGILFIWMGTAFVTDIGWGAGILGVGVIAIGAQVVRRFFGISFDRFGLVIGIVFFFGGVWMLLNIELSEAAIPGGLLPILMIAAGIAIVASALLRKPKQ